MSHVGPALEWSGREEAPTVFVLHGRLELETVTWHASRVGLVPSGGGEACPRPCSRGKSSTARSREDLERGLVSCRRAARWPMFLAPTYWSEARAPLEARMEQNAQCCRGAAGAGVVGTSGRVDPPGAGGSGDGCRTPVATASFGVLVLVRVVAELGPDSGDEEHARVRARWCRCQSAGAAQNARPPPGQLLDPGSRDGVERGLVNQIAAYSAFTRTGSRGSETFGT